MLTFGAASVGKTGRPDCLSRLREEWLEEMFEGAGLKTGERVVRELRELVNVPK